MKYSHLTWRERGRVFKVKCDGKEIGRDKSTMARELRRNSDSVGGLYPHEADLKVQERRRKGRKKNRQYFPNSRSLSLKSSKAGYPQR